MYEWPIWSSNTKLMLNTACEIPQYMFIYRDYKGHVMLYGIISDNAQPIIRFGNREYHGDDSRAVGDLSNTRSVRSNRPAFQNGRRSRHHATFRHWCSSNTFGRSMVAWLISSSLSFFVWDTGRSDYVCLLSAISRSGIGSRSPVLRWRGR